MSRPGEEFQGQINGTPAPKPAGQATPGQQQQQQAPTGQRIEAIKQFYNQLCTNLRHIVTQLNAPELTPQRRQALLQQQEQVQKSLQEFTEKVLKPLASAAAANQGGATGGVAGGLAASASVASLPPSASVMASQTASALTLPLGMGTKSAVGSTSATKIPSSMTSAAGGAPIPVPQPPPMMFQNAPPAARQVLMTIQKQLAQIQQQQMLFNQKLMSKNFDSAVSQAPPKESERVSSGFCLVTSQNEEREADAFGRVDPTATSRTVGEFLHGIDPKLRVTRELEHGLLRLADDFVDGLSMFAIQMALNRKDARVTKKDFEVAAERLYGLVLPGSSRSAVLSTSVKKLSKRNPGGTTTNPHHTRMAQLKKFLALNPQ